MKVFISLDSYERHQAQLLLPSARGFNQKNRKDGLWRQVL